MSLHATDALHIFDYSSEQLKLREYQDLKVMKGKLAQIIHSRLEDFEIESNSLSEDLFLSKIEFSVF